MMTFDGQALVWLSISLVCGAAVCDEQYFQSSVPPPEQLFKIMFMLPTPVPSHVMSVAPLVAALASRGHEVHMLCDSPDVFKIPNVTCIPVGVNLPRLEEMPSYSRVDNNIAYLKLTASALQLYTELFLSSPAMMELHERRKEYDIIVIEQMMLTGLHSFVHETTFAIFSTSYLNPCESAEFGNLQNPMHVTSGLSEYPQPYSFINRVKNLASTIAFCFVYQWTSGLVQKLNREQFPGLPSLVEIQRNASLHLVTTSSALEGPLTLLPLQVAVGGLIMRPSKPLPQDIADFLEGDDPVVYVSFGITYVDENTIGRNNKEMFISVLRRLPYKVIFKLRGEQKRKVGNILFHYDVPQQDILAHHNVKAFVSHCGLSGTQEAMYNGVPIVGFPITWEHIKTAMSLEAAGVGIHLSWSSVTEDALENAIKEVMSNPSYRQNMAALSRRYRDQPETPLDRAVYWTEYVARYRGAPHLQSPTKKMSLVQILGIDIIACLFLILFFVYILLKRLYNMMLARITVGVKKKKLS